MENLGKLSIAIAEDLEEDRKLLLHFLENLEWKLQILWISKNGKEFWESYQQAIIKPQIVLLDYRMPFINGIELMQKIKALEPKQKVVLCSHACPPETELKSLRNYSHTWFSPKIPDELTEFINCAINGVPHYSQDKVHETWRFLSSRYQLHNHDDLEIKRQLNELELQLLRLCCSKLTNYEMAHHLGMSYSKFNAIKAKVKQRLGIQSDHEIQQFLQSYHL